MRYLKPQRVAKLLRRSDRLSQQLRELETERRALKAAGVRSGHHRAALSGKIEARKEWIRRIQSELDRA